MTYKLVAAFLCACLVFSSCNDKPSHDQQSNSPQFHGKYTLKRIAGKEYRFTDAALCKAVAEAFYNGSYPHHTDADVNDGNLTKVSDAPLSYSMKAKDEDIEVRFAVVDNDELTQYGDLIYYYEINKDVDNDEDNVKAAAVEFKKATKGKILKDAFQDKFSIDKRKSWRAILAKKKKDEKLLLIMDDEAYGIVINPPYPR